MGRYLRDIRLSWPVGTPLPAAGIFFFYDPATDEEYKVLPEQLGSPAVVPGANVPLLDPARTNYPVGFEVRWFYGGVSYNLYSINGGGPHPPPPDEGGDGNWGRIGLTPYATDLYKAYELGYAQYQLNHFPEKIKTGALHLLHGLWNSAPAPDTVEVEGGQNGFAALGTLVSDGTRQAVTVDVAAGTYSTNLGTGGGGGSSELPVRHTNVVTFDASAIYDTVYSVQAGALPFSLDTSTLKGSGLAFILVYPLPDGPDLTDPLLDLAAGASFRPYTKQLYAFAWGLDSRIQLTITSFT